MTLGRWGAIKKICFAILVHEQPEIVRDMVENVRYFCPSSSIVLYNGGYTPNLCNGLGEPVCPASRPIPYGKLAIYILDVMKWLHQVQFDFDYLITLDSDALFAKKGFEDFISSELQNADYMGVNVRVPERNWYPGQSIRREWWKWRPIFNSDQFLCCFNVGQTFSKRLVQRIVEFEKIDLLEKNIRETTTFALEEIVFVTLARTFGFPPKSFPWNGGRSIRFRPHYRKEEVECYLKLNMRDFLFHPVHRSMQDGARAYIRNLIK